ncbi:hypothetical protein FB451DRAFT_1179900 [Mycena latifolia]|nr:hypothetical protein FB451DRAFT_1179900 [Mycena latifolia]
MSVLRWRGSLPSLSATPTAAQSVFDHWAAVPGWKIAPLEKGIKLEGIVTKISTRQGLNPAIPGLDTGQALTPMDGAKMNGGWHLAVEQIWLNSFDYLMEYLRPTSCDRRMKPFAQGMAGMILL